MLCPYLLLITKEVIPAKEAPHCAKSVRIRSYSGPNAGKYGPK